jgi:hypothetical protein
VEGALATEALANFHSATLFMLSMHSQFFSLDIRKRISPSTRTIIIINFLFITMNISKLFSLAILCAVGGSVVFDVPAIITALIIGVITIFAYACHLFTSTMDRYFMSPVEKRRKSRPEKEGSMFGRFIVRCIDKRADDTFMFLRKILSLFFFGGIGMIQTATGFALASYSRFWRR